MELSRVLSATLLSPQLLFQSAGNAITFTPKGRLFTCIRMLLTARWAGAAAETEYTRPHTKDGVSNRKPM